LLVIEAQAVHLCLDAAFVPHTVDYDEIKGYATISLDESKGDELKEVVRHESVESVLKELAKIYFITLELQENPVSE